MLGNPDIRSGHLERGTCPGSAAAVGASLRRLLPLIVPCDVIVVVVLRGIAGTWYM